MEKKIVGYAVYNEKGIKILCTHSKAEAMINATIENGWYVPLCHGPYGKLVKAD